MAPLRCLTALALAAVLVAMSGPACDRGSGKRTRALVSSASPADSQPVARIDDVVITVGDVQERINKQAPFTRGRYTALDKRKELLDNLIRVEVMAKEAEKRGYDQDPEVVRVKKQQMISRFLQKEFESKLRVEDVPEVEVQKYYKEHPEEFSRPDEVRVSQILVKDKARAEKIAVQARAADRNDLKAFRDLVTKFSQDEDSKPRGGDLTSFDKASTLYPRPVVEAAFALSEIGDISAPVSSDQGYHILRLTQKRRGFSSPLGEVKRQIQQRLFRDMRTKALDTFIAELKSKYSVTIDEANLAKVNIDTGMDTRAVGAGPASSPGPGLPVKMGTTGNGQPASGPRQFPPVGASARSILNETRSP
jgi:peptidyl-prolyl cis-trans isomerase C